jgi:hypothetical protein
MTLTTSRNVDAELLRVLRLQTPPAAESHGLRAHDAPDGISFEQVLQDVQADVPSGRTHGDAMARASSIVRDRPKLLRQA